MYKYQVFPASIISSAVCLSLIATGTVNAQIVPDTTLPNNSNVKAAGKTIKLNHLQEWPSGAIYARLGLRAAIQQQGRKLVR